MNNGDLSRRKKRKLFIEHGICVYLLFFYEIKAFTSQTLAAFYLLINWIEVMHMNTAKQTSLDIKLHYFHNAHTVIFDLV